jgi:Ni2+-binding GTPase involved in maturation of urease and hydrogenase
MKAHYVMVGGFLGAGKTTALYRAGEYLAARGIKTGLIMNDQTEALVDTAIVRSRNLPVEEIAGGCFCCRFNSLIEAAERLDRDARPEVLLAEPVGSCTDLAATVVLPLRQLYGDRFVVAPLSVLIDPERALRVLGLEPGRAFSPKVQYVYEKQLDEADVLAINKVDVTHPSRLARLRESLETRYPRARVIELSARAGTGLEPWIDSLLGGEADGHVLEIDYDTYAEGEALLGWLNCTAVLAGPEVDGDELVGSIAARIHRTLAIAGTEIAHLKLTLTPASGGGIAVVNAVRSEAGPEMAFRLDGFVDRGGITINLRAEADPGDLERAVRTALNEEARARETTIDVTHLEQFRPGRPVPTHRFARAGR